jgi:hypothetical protein
MVWQTTILRADGKEAAIVTQTQLVMAGWRHPSTASREPNAAAARSETAWSNQRHVQRVHVLNTGERRIARWPPPHAQRRGAESPCFVLRPRNRWRHGILPVELFFDVIWPAPRKLGFQLRPPVPKVIVSCIVRRLWSPDYAMIEPIQLRDGEKADQCHSERLPNLNFWVGPYGSPKQKAQCKHCDNQS